MRSARVPATVLLAGLLAIAFALTACSTGGTTVSSAELAKLQLDSDTRQIERIDVVFHLAASTKNIPLLMSLYADDVTVTFGGKTYTGTDQVRSFFEQAGPFQHGTDWVCDGPSYTME